MSNGSHNERRRISERHAALLREHRYALLLPVLLASLAIQSFGAATGTDGLLSDIFATALIVAIYVVVFTGPRTRIAMAVMTAGVIATGWASHILAVSFDHWLSVSHQTLTGICLWLSVWVILRDLFGHRAIGGENVLGAFCGYL